MSAPRIASAMAGAVLVRKLMESVRDVIDCWDDIGPYPDSGGSAEMSERIEAMRAALFAVRQHVDVP